MIPPLRPGVRASVVVPARDEADRLSQTLAALYDQRDQCGPLDRSLYEVIIVDNGSSDGTGKAALAFANSVSDLAVHVVTEEERGVAVARRTGMDLAVSRSRSRDRGDCSATRFYLCSADADCTVDPHWLAELLHAMDLSGAALGVCDYYYCEEHFASRPRLWATIARTLRCRQAAFRIFGGFPDGKGFAVERSTYERVGGIELWYQLKEGHFEPHLSDDWDFGIRVRALGGDAVYVPTSRVEINARRVDHATEDVIAGKAYGSGGTIVMRDIRPAGTQPLDLPDLTPEEAVTAWHYSVKDFLPKNLILPALLTPALLLNLSVRDFFTAELADRIGHRIAEITEETRMKDFSPIHAYKSPCYRLYFEFADELFARLRHSVGPDIGLPPPLPECLADATQGFGRKRFREFVRYYCDDRESGDAHDYFANGGVY